MVSNSESCEVRAKQQSIHPQVLPTTSGLLFLVLLALIAPSLIAQAPAGGTTQATVVQPMSKAIVFNLYWDSNWDADNPQLTRGEIDAATQAVINSTYIATLSEYGVTSVTFGGSFLPNQKCVQQAPAAPGFFVPSGPGISQFIQCEHDNESVLQNNSAVYNVILPQSSLESDFWTRGFCTTPGSSAGWHYHGLPDLSIFPYYVPFSGAPAYAIVMTAPACFIGNAPQLPSAAFFENLTHEMIEALTDPFPINISILPTQIRVTLDTEIADICEASKPVPNSGPISVFIDSSQNPSTARVSVASHWSNKQQTCLGFADSTVPTIKSFSVTNWGSQTALSVAGSGFGTMPSQVDIPNTKLPYLTLNNNNPQTWQAGNTIDGDPTLLNIQNWSPTASKSNFVGGVGINVAPSAALSLLLCNPNSLLCASHNGTSAPGPYNPRIEVTATVSGNFSASPDTISVSNGTQKLIDEKIFGICEICEFLSPVMTLAPGNYNFTDAVSGKVTMKSISNGCKVSLTLGDETGCTVAFTGPANTPPPPACTPPNILRSCGGKAPACMSQYAVCQ
jgi:hypothetical protein